MRITLLLISVMLSYSMRTPALALQIAPLHDKMEDTIDSTTVDWKNNFRFGLATMATVTSNKQVPFWMRSNQFGSIPLEGPSISLIGSIGRDYSKNRKKKLTDWGAYIEPRFNIGKRSELLLIEGYVKGRLGIFQLKAGRSRDMMGLVDSTLSSGAFSISGNALGIPKVEVSIPEFWDLPFLNKTIAVKGNFAHGWLGNTEVKNSKVDEIDTYFHQKSFYARLGRPNWRLKIFGGFNHQVYWGNERILNGNKFTLSTLQTYKYVVFGRGYGGPDIGIPRSKIGNHLGSIDQAFSYDAKRVTFLAYHQFLYEVGGLYHLNNIKDGVFGLSIKNKVENSTTVQLRKIVFEYINTKSQGGEIDAKVTPSGDEDYYNNFIYKQGWTYKGENLGNPLLTSRTYARANLPTYSNEFIVNNRVRGFHMAAEGKISSWSVILKATYSLNYGTYGTSPWGHSLMHIRIPSKPPYFQEERQLSAYIAANRGLSHHMNLAFCVAVDNGSMIYNSLGASVKISKYW